MSAPGVLPGALRRAVLGAVLLAVFCAPEALGQPAPGRALVIGIDEESSTYGGILGRLIYAEISRRMGIRFEVRSFPEQRRGALSGAGAIDGETSRIHAYAATQPNLVRVEEAVIDLNFSLYTADPALHVPRLAALGEGDLRVEYRRGILFCDRALRSVMPAERVSDVAESAQGVKKLLAGRTDAFCDVDFGIITVLRDRRIEGIARVRRLLDLGTVPTYPYLHHKHAGLAPRMAATIRQMKAEGLIDRFRRGAERDMGWVQ